MKLIAVVVLLLQTVYVPVQAVSSPGPATIVDSQLYLFYLHGALITEMGNNATNRGAPEWGPYEYLNILDSLKTHGYNVISEIRKREVDNQFYVDKIARQIDSLLRKGVGADQIIVVGASSGWDITLRVSSKMQNEDLNFVIMGGCWPESYKDYRTIELYGNFLSIIEKTDPHKTCGMIFTKRKRIKGYKEIELNTGLSHGFFYKGRKDWIEPISEWVISGLKP
jgi:hypothetical protein